MKVKYDLKEIERTCRVNEKNQYEAYYKIGLLEQKVDKLAKQFEAADHLLGELRGREQWMYDMEAYTFETRRTALKLKSKVDKMCPDSDISEKSENVGKEEQLPTDFTEDELEMIASWWEVVAKTDLWVGCYDANKSLYGKVVLKVIDNG